ncbi:MAG: hypothetical protein HYX67_16645 [Candidatus Melainabacteria bacterium]|nr:hypothetical protein [Candidatus Melainabacteria bacterium]
MPSYSEGSSALSNRVQDLMPRNFSKSVNELPSSIHFAPEIYGDGWKNDLPAASSEQIKSKLDSASGIVFSSAADNVENKVEPDFYLGEDGKLRANPKKTAPNEDGSVNIELQTKNKNESDAIKYSDQMQKAAVKDLINYFRQSNPNGRVPQHWLDMLSKEPDLPPAPAPISVSRPDVAPEPTQPTKESPRTQTPQAERTSGGAGGGSGGGGGGGGSGGGNRGGGEGNISRSGDTSAGPDVNLNASVPKAMQIMDYFVEKGLTPQQAAGITGNLQRESLLNPGITEGGGGGGYGLAQWTGERRQELETFAATAGQPASDLKVQLDFLWKEMNSTETGALQAFKADPNMSAAEAAKVFCEKFERPGVVAMNDRTSGAEQFFAAYKNGGDQGATAVNAPAPTEFNEHLVAAVKQQDAAMSGTGKCATAVQRALAACGLPEFLGSGNGGEMDKPLLASGKFTQVSINDAKPGDIIVRPPSANPNDTSVYGDVSVVTARNGDNITQTNDATYQFKKDNPRYDGKATFLRYTG